jgi:superfamily II DNA or RNA helicase
MQLELGNGNESCPKKIEFRDYQSEAIDAVQSIYQSGQNRQLVVLPTGTGKTVLFAGIAYWCLKSKKKVLVLAQREELLEQAREKIGWIIGGGFSMDIEMAEQWASTDADVILASVQTIGRTGNDRICRFKPEEFGLVIIDEAHHAISNTHQNVIDYFVEKRKDILLLGVTATPNRSDEESLAEVFEVVAYQKTMLDMARAGWLAPPVSYRISSTTDLSKVKTTAGDYNLNDLAKAVNNEARNTLIVETYAKKFMGRQALVFATDLEHVHRLTDEFQKIGVKAAAVTGDLDKTYRRQIIAEFKAKKIEIVVNYGVLTEGFDYEALGVIIQARPTQSSLLLTQMIGRANRLHPDKKMAEVIEIIDFHSEKTATVASLFGFRKDFDCESHDFLECVNKVEELQKDFPSFNFFNTRSWTEMLARYEYLKEKAKVKFEMPVGEGGGMPRSPKPDLYFEEVPDQDFLENRYRFTFVAVNSLVMQFRDERSEKRFMVKIHKGALGNWIARIISKPINMAVSLYAEEEFSVEASHQMDVVKAVELWILKNYGHLDHLLNVNASWRKRVDSDPVTDKQWEIIKRNNLTSLPRQSVTKGMAMSILTQFFDKKSVRR